MKKFVYTISILCSILYADSTSYTRVAWTEVPNSAFKTAEFYNTNQNSQNEIVDNQDLKKEQQSYEIESKIESSSNFIETKEEVVKLDRPVWIFVE